MEFPVEYFHNFSPLLDNQDCYHRRGITNCPHCGEDFKDLWTWEKSPHLIHVIFDLRRFYKKGHFLTVSSCPKCKQLSWCHGDLDWTIHHIEFNKTYAPDDTIAIDIEKLKEERIRWTNEIKEKWDNSLCKRCVQEKTVDEDKYGFYIKCDGRWGPPAMSDEQPPHRCTSFKEG